MSGGRERTCAAVLAGGRSTRFGSDKALARFGGEPLLARTLRLLAPLAAERAVVAKELGLLQAHAAAAGAAGITDASPLSTPLAGLAAALAWAPRERLFACAADMPFVADAPLLEALHAALDRDPGASAALAFHGGSLQTLCGLWVAPACAGLAAGLLSREKVGPRALLDQLRFATVPWPADQGRPFLDADTPEALAALAAQG